MTPGSCVLTSPYDPVAEGLLWRGMRPVCGRLRCAVVLARPSVEQWAASLVSLLEAEPALAIEAVCLLEEPGGPVQPRGCLFRRLEEWSSRTAAPGARVDFVAPERAIEIRLPQDAERLRELSLDALISLEIGVLNADFAAFARLGQWSIGYGDPPGWAEVRDREPVTSAAVIQTTAAGQRVVARVNTATAPGLRFTANAVMPLRLASAALVRSLLDTLDRGRLPSEPGAAVPSPGRRAAGNFATAAFVARQALRSAALRARARGRESRWFVALRDCRERFRSHSGRFRPEGFHPVPMPEGHAYADPFVVEHAGRHWLFVEEIPPGSKGRLACLEILEDGGFGTPTVVLEQPYHLSYPQVFAHRGAHFMLPETGHNRSVELYRADRFPDRWTLEHVYHSGVAAVDTTVFLLDGIWYFFTTAGAGASETFLFWSESLAGKWNYHPANPICSDVRRARGAGSLFYSGGDLIRPAQDCSIRYGYAIALNRIRRLTTTEYEEEPIETILPDWAPGLLCTHTLNANARYEAIDGAGY